MKRLQNKVAIITGASRGIGRAIAELFAAQGARVVINYKSNRQAAQQTLTRLAKDSQAIAIQADIASSAGRKHLLQAALDEFGQFDILVNNAGILHFSDFIEYSENDFDALMATNSKAPFFLCQDFAKQIIQQKTAASIINISSMCAFRTSAYPIESYEMSKAALTMLSKSLANSLAKHHIRVNTISPGIIKTDINRANWESNSHEWQETMRCIPQAHAGEGKDVAAAALYLATDDARYTTGADIIIDGGLTSYFPV